MTLPDVRRLLQILFAPEVPKHPIRHAIEISAWRQNRNRIARECHAKTRKEHLRKTG
jgi:hypothetical protein